MRGGELGRASANPRFNGSIGFLQLCAIQRNATHFAPALEDRHNQKNILEQNPGGVFHPTPRASCEHSKNRERPVNAAQEMVGRNDHRRGYHDAPIAIKCEKSERSKNVKMRFDATATKMN